MSRNKFLSCLDSAYFLGHLIKNFIKKYQRVDLTFIMFYFLNSVRGTNIELLLIITPQLNKENNRNKSDTIPLVLTTSAVQKISLKIDVLNIKL